MNPTPFAIRKARIEDAAQIAYVHTQSWKTSYTSIIADDYLNSLDEQQKKEQWVQILNNSDADAYVATIGTEVVGLASGGRCRSEGTYRSELYALYILQQYQGLGIGRELFKALAISQKEQGMENMMVWVLRDNPARLFYQRMGGLYLYDEQVTIGNIQYIEEAYGWTDINTLLV
jgi:GNAT superfamily N-acetyltransferase